MAEKLNIFIEYSSKIVLEPARTLFSKVIFFEKYINEEILRF